MLEYSVFGETFKFVEERRLGEISSVIQYLEGSCGGEVVLCSQGCMVRGEVSSGCKKKKTCYKY